MGNLRRFILIIDITLGISVFAALFHSSFGTAERSFFGLAFLTLAFMIEVYFLQSDTINQDLTNGIYVALKVLEKRLGGDVDITIDQALESELKEMHINSIASGQGTPHILMITLRFGGWILGGWLLNQFLFPNL